MAASRPIIGFAFEGRRIATLGGIRRTWPSAALRRVFRDTDGRAFALSTLNSMLEVAPFPGLVGPGPTGKQEA